METKRVCKLIEGNRLLEDEAQDWFLKFSCGEVTYGTSRRDYLASIISHACRGKS